LPSAVAKRVETARKLDKAIVASLHARNSSREVHDSIEQKAVGADQPHDPSEEVYTTSGKKKMSLNERGADEVEFYVSTNLGEEVRPLAKLRPEGKSPASCWH